MPHALVLAAIALSGYAVLAPAQLNTTANIRNTKHNLSTSGSGTTKSSTEDQVCVFCHTPHAANSTAPAPLWNRKIGGTTDDANTYTASYNPYQSDSLNAIEAVPDGSGIKTLPPPGGASKLCLSCHDGTLALGTVGVLDGKANPATITGLTGTMPGGLGATTGFTRNLGVDLRNDHPISFTFDSNLATSDGELRSPPYSVSDKVVVGKRSSGVKPMLPLDHEGKVQCTSCHDPHLEASRFLRLNRLQKVAAAGGDFSAANDQICLGCHNKLGTAWSNSAHADSNVADEAYTTLAAGAARRDFLVSGVPARVWEAGCLNCHDTHSVQGSRRLLREGVETTLSTTADSSAYQSGSTNAPASVSAIENTCYQCHQGTATKVIGTATGTVPNIRSEFERTIHMPIKTAQQGGGSTTTERHTIANADFMETPEQLGLGNHTNRHVECTDCHNPHRVRRNSLFNGLGDSTKRTHNLATGTNGVDGNVASGVLRGIWGVEPDYFAIVGTSTTWPNSVSVNYTVKSGDPGTNPSTSKSANWLTREYQLCLKCHSDYSGTSAGKMPALGGTTLGGTASGTNGLSRYTNVAVEFAANANDTLTGADQGETGNDTNYGPATNNGAPTAAPNHRSWHPVIFPTARTSAERMGSQSGSFSNIRSPFNTTANIGKQTMHCSDCHGSAESWSQKNTGDNTNGPNLANVQGPHGSGNNFLLKGIWNYSIYIGDADGSNTNGTLCGRCHAPVSGKGGFSNGDAAHSKSDHQQMGRCMFCHIAVPHGWKNKAFLANLNCLGPEVGKAAGCTNAFGQSDLEVTKQLWAEPYYNGSLLRIATWRSSDAWTDTSCGTGTKTGSGWMSGTCQNAASVQQAQSTGY